MHEVKGLFFDVGGTVFDWKNTARQKIQKLADEKGQAIDSEAFANDWRGERKAMSYLLDSNYKEPYWSNTLDGEEIII